MNLNQKEEYAAGMNIDKYTCKDPKGNTTAKISKEEYTIRIPIEVIQRTKKDGTVHPLIFYWHDNTNEMPIKVKINRIISITPQHERSSGTVGDRYEVDVGGIRELIYYSKLQPRKWFRIVVVSEEEYKGYYRVDGDG